MGVKLRLGAALLGVAGASTGCEPVDETQMCYAAGPPQPDRISLDAYANGQVEVVLSVSTTLSGAINDRQSSTFSFAVVDDPQGTTLQQGDVPAADGAMDEPTEDFTLTIDSSMPPGSYRLEFYNAPSGQANPTTIAAFTLVVTS